MKIDNTLGTIVAIWFILRIQKFHILPFVQCTLMLMANINID